MKQCKNKMKGKKKKTNAISYILFTSDLVLILAIPGLDPVTEATQGRLVSIICLLVVGFQSKIANNPKSEY